VVRTHAVLVSSSSKPSWQCLLHTWYLQSPVLSHLFK
jgi:hypothetical protein